MDSFAYPPDPSFGPETPSRRQQQHYNYHAYASPQPMAMHVNSSGEDMFLDLKYRSSQQQYQASPQFQALTPMSQYSTSLRSSFTTKSTKWVPRTPLQMKLHVDASDDMNDNFSPDTVARPTFEVRAPRSSSDTTNPMSTSSTDSTTRSSFSTDEDEIVMMTLPPARKKSHSFHPRSSLTAASLEDDVESRQLYSFSYSGESLIDVPRAIDNVLTQHARAGLSAGASNGHQEAPPSDSSPPDKQAEHDALQGSNADISTGPTDKNRANKRSSLLAYRAIEEALRDEEDAARSEADATDCSDDADVSFLCHHNYCCDKCDGCSQCCLQLVNNENDEIDFLDYNYSEEEEHNCKFKDISGYPGTEGRNNANAFAAPRRIKYDGGFFVNHNNQSERIEFLLDHLDLSAGRTGSSSSGHDAAAPTNSRLLSLPRLMSMEDDGEDDLPFNEGRGKGYQHGQHQTKSKTPSPVVQNGNSSSLFIRKKSITGVGPVGTMPDPSLSITRSFEVATF